MRVPPPTAISGANRTARAASPGRRPISRTNSPASPDAAAPHPRRHLFGRRKGPRLSAHQESLRTDLLPKVALKQEQGRHPRFYFSDAVEDVWLEIGFGSGEHLLWQAQANPRIGMMGAEPYISGVAKLVSKLEQTKLSNLRIHEGDARDVMSALPASSLARVFILFPDPWPKKRHHKRRFIQMEMLDEFARILEPGAELRFASDDPGYFAWTLERLAAHKSFAWTASCAAEWKTRPADWPMTRYEAKALHGPPRYLRFVRV